MKKILSFIFGGIIKIISGIIGKILGLIVKFLGFLLSHLIGLVAKLFSALGSLIGMLPLSPFQHAFDSLGDFEFIGYMNYFIPFQALQTILGVWIAAISVYMVYKLVKKYLNISTIITHFIGG